MIIKQTAVFKKKIKKLHKNQKKILDDEVRKLIKEHFLGTRKKGDLNDVLVHKFKLIKQEILLAYCYEETEETITLLALGSHENFYRNLKK